jgi:D-serine deaminase-like pyridoxal phosphate-dependent protein
MALAEVDTPALVVDLDALRRNIAAMADIAGAAGLALRPHAKTHKSAEIARMQVAAGAAGICCQTVSEAEAMAADGISDLLITNQVVGETKLRRLADLAGRVRLSVLVDDAGNVADVARHAAAVGSRIGALVEIETGDRRAGIDPVLAGELARRIAASRHLNFIGLQAYKGSTEHVIAASARRSSLEVVFAAVRAALASIDSPCPVVTGGGTGTAGLVHRGDPLTELQPGSYVFMDGNYALLDGAGFTPSLFLLATVLTRTVADRAMVNAGTKALCLEAGLPALPDHPGIIYARADDEHGRLEIGASARPLALGDRVRLIPANCDPTVNLHDWYVVVQGGVVVDVWPVTARGAVF